MNKNDLKSPKNKVLPPLAIFGNIEQVASEQYAAHLLDLSAAQQRDIAKARDFLLCYRGNATTFNAYRRELERFLQWCAKIAAKSLHEVNRQSFEAYIEFCQSPPLAWIGLQKKPRFIAENFSPNPDWRPFVVTISKAAKRQGQTPIADNYQISQKALQEIFTVLSSFYNFLIQENYLDSNPVALIRQKSKYFRKNQQQQEIRRLSELQWGYVLETAEKMAHENPSLHERTLFIMNALYGMYLRISELAANKRWIPLMSHFKRDQDGLWWFTTVGKGNKERRISVSDAMIAALKRYRQSLNLSPTPLLGENTPLISKFRGKGPINSTRQIREIVQQCFDCTISRLNQDGFSEEALQLTAATVHWLRHTGISDDVKIRPREHVRDDAGHSSGAITDKYIDVELRERHASARHKVIKPTSFVDD